MAIATLLTGGNFPTIDTDINTVRSYISKHLGTIIQCSIIQKSDPLGFESDHYFLNQIVIIDTSLSPNELLFKIWDIERLYGRERLSTNEELLKWKNRHENGVKTYTSRAIDIDILYYDNQIIETDYLIIPHKEIENRPFVLSLLNSL